MRLKVLQELNKKFDRSAFKMRLEKNRYDLDDSDYKTFLSIFAEAFSTQVTYRRIISYKPDDTEIFNPLSQIKFSIILFDLFSTRNFVPFILN